MDNLTNAIECIKAPCLNPVADTPETITDNAMAQGLEDKKFSLKSITKKQIIVTAVALLFLLGLFFNKQIRSFLNA